MFLKEPTNYDNPAEIWHRMGLDVDDGVEDIEDFEEDEDLEEAEKIDDLGVLLDRIKKLNRMRNDIIKQDLGAGNRIRAAKRRDKEWSRKGIPAQDEDEMGGQLDLFDSVTKMLRDHSRRQMKKLAGFGKQLPHADWYVGFRGLNYASYAQMLGEMGNPLNYDNPAKIWRRMGLAVDAGRAHKNREKGRMTGYSKDRRALMYVVANNVILHRNKEKGDPRYCKVYEKRKAYEQQRDEEGYNIHFVESNRNSLLISFSSSDNQKKINSGRLPQAVIHLRANRYVAKKILKDLWRKWHGQED